METNQLILWAALVMASCGVVLGLLIAAAVSFFRIDADPRIEAVADLLPGANCGGCGQAGCLDFAKGVVAGNLQPNQCPVSSQEIRSAVARVLGIEVGISRPMVAVVLCGGSTHHVKTLTPYNGLTDCVAAAQVSGGPKSCSYGCLGLATCARICPFNAIEMVDGLAIVHADRCVGCGQCLKACPRNLIKLVPADATLNVYCSSPAKAPIKKAACSIPCIGCRKCLKAGAEGMFKADGFKVSVNYENAELPGAELVEKAACPTGCLQLRDKHIAVTLQTEGTQE